MGFPRQEYWSGLPFPSPGDLADPGIKPASVASPALASGFVTTITSWEAHTYVHIHKCYYVLDMLPYGLSRTNLETYLNHDSSK